MKYISAYALAVLGGKSQPTVEDLTAILNEVGAQVCQESAKRVVDSLHGKNLNDVIAQGLTKVQSLSFGGSGSGAAAPVQAAAVAPVAAKKEEPKKEEKVEEEFVDAGGLFGDDY